MMRWYGILVGLAMVGGAGAQVVVKHVQTDKSPIATGVWAGDTFYLSGQLAVKGK